MAAHKLGLIAFDTVDSEDDDITEYIGFLLINLRMFGFVQLSAYQMCWTSSRVRRKVAMGLGHLTGKLQFAVAVITLCHGSPRSIVIVNI